MAVISVINQKGGVAKTTTCINIASEWFQKGKKVLLIDLDPQSSATKAVFEESKFEKSIYDVMVNRTPVTDAIIHSQRFGFDMVPAEILLSGVDVQLAAQFGREKILRKALEVVKKKYDIILIDCSPSLGLLTINALMASKEIIIPICPEFFSMKGLELILDTLENMRCGLGHKVDVRGVVITRFRDRKINRQVIDEVKRVYRLKVFRNYIPDNIVVEEAHHKHLPVGKYRPNSKASIAYAQLAKEID